MHEFLSGSGFRVPGTGYWGQGSGLWLKPKVQYPEPSTQYPVSRIPYPASPIPFPVSRFQYLLANHDLFNYLALAVIENQSVNAIRQRPQVDYLLQRANYIDLCFLEDTDSKAVIYTDCESFSRSSGYGNVYQSVVGDRIDIYCG